jgi:hypothetical protein
MQKQAKAAAGSVSLSSLSLKNGQWSGMSAAFHVCTVAIPPSDERSEDPVTERAKTQKDTLIF